MRNGRGCKEEEDEGEGTKGGREGRYLNETAFFFFCHRRLLVLHRVYDLIFNQYKVSWFE